MQFLRLALRTQSLGVRRSKCEVRWRDVPMGTVELQCIEYEAGQGTAIKKWGSSVVYVLLSPFRL